MKTFKRTNAACTLLVLVLTFTGSAVPALFAAEMKITGNHPISLTEKPKCTECHVADTEVGLKPIEIFNHDGDWIPRHRFLASRTTEVCNVCHKVSFCTDCHAYKEELKPSDKHPESPERWLPHRGDYLFQHRIDGRIDPTSCFRCHGTQNNGICRRCHK